MASRAGQGRRRAHEASEGLDVRGGDGAFGCAAAATTVRVPRPAARGMSRRWREDRTTHRPPPKPKQQTIGGPSIDFQEFVRRQGRDSSRRARKAEARQKETPRECSFKPRLCENSKRMARNSKFDDRQNRLEARRLQRMASGDREKFSGHLESDAKNPPDAPRPRETFRCGPGVRFRAPRRWRNG